MSLISAIVQRGDVQWSAVDECPSIPRRAGRRWHTHPAALILQSALQIQTSPLIALIALIVLVALILPCKFKHYDHDEAEFQQMVSHKVHYWVLSNNSSIPTQYFSFTVQYNIYISNKTTYFHCFDFDRELIFSHIRSQCVPSLDKKDHGLTQKIAKKASNPFESTFPRKYEIFWWLNLFVILFHATLFLRRNFSQFFTANLQILEAYYQQDKYFLFFYSDDPEFGWKFDAEPTRGHESEMVGL